MKSVYTISRRTDVPGCHWEWFQNRLLKKYVGVRNPYYPEKVSIYDLSPDKVSLLYFLSKNYRPLLEGNIFSLERLSSEYNCCFEYTITGYGHDMESRVPLRDESIQTLRELSNRVGADKVSWCYDPILFSFKYDLNFHLENFAYIAKSVAGYVRRVRINIVNMYDKVSRNASDIRQPFPNEKVTLLDYISNTCQDVGIKMTCCPGSEYVRYGFTPEVCLPNNKGKCLMCGMNSDGSKRGSGLAKDIGKYDTCTHGCRYCYATEDHARAAFNAKYCFVNYDMLYDGFRETDIITDHRG